VRALWAWQDTNNKSHLAVGTENITGLGYAELTVITNGAQVDISPRTGTTDISPVFDTTAGSAVVRITDSVNQDITEFDSVYIQTHVAVGGLILFGNYRTYPVSSTEYEIIARDIFGNPQLAPSTSALPVVAEFDVIAGQSLVTVTLPDHGFSVGDTYPILVSTTLGGVTLFGNYIVQAVPSTSTFEIFATTLPSSTANAFINGGDVRFAYAFGVGPTLLGYGYGGSGYGSGGYGTGTSTASVGVEPDCRRWHSKRYP